MARSASAGSIAALEVARVVATAGMEGRFETAIEGTDVEAAAGAEGDALAAGVASSHPGVERARERRVDLVLDRLHSCLPCDARERRRRGVLVRQAEKRPRPTGGVRPPATSPRKSRRKSACFLSTVTATPARARTSQRILEIALLLMKRLTGCFREDHRGMLGRRSRSFSISSGA